ncbi:MAG: glycosyl hydrolase, partial [Bacteroidia bacterium]
MNTSIHGVISESKLSDTISNSIAQIVPVGSGSYITNFPGTDAAGRNTFPSGSPLLTGNALGKPVPTNDWWSNKVKNNHSDNLFNYPFTLKTVPSGLVVSYIPWGVIDNILPVVVGVSGLNAAAAKVSDYSDWTVSLNWNDNNRSFTATSGIAMPFLYFTKDSSSLAQVTVNEGTVTIDNEKLIIINARNGADFAVYAPLGSVWLKTGNVYTSTLNGKNYWSLAFIPLTASNVMSVANEYKKYAYVFPKNTLAHWQFNESTSTVRTDFIVEPDVKEGQDTTLLIGLLPHQWAHLAPGSAPLNGYVYQHVRGQIKTTAANRFSVENQFHGILPTLPYVDNYSTGFNPAQLIEKIDAIKNDGLSTWTDSYNEGQVMNRLIQTARIAELAKDTASLAIMLKTIKDRLENWFTAKPGEIAFLFYYNQTWSTLIGYPAGHGQDGNINDHHFHWGYFIHAASFIEQYEPGWKDKWGAMVNLLVKDAANNDRNSTDYPHLRNFSLYAGHCWANGFATFPQGNDQESTSESMQFNSSLIHWGAVTNNKAIRDLGIYLYTTEQTAIEEYWFDQNKRIFGPNQQYSLVSRVWGNSYDNGTFWTADIAASYGIELYPIHGGSFYLGKDTAYVKRLWAEMEKNTGILSNQVNDNLWHDVYWKYLALIDPSKALTLYNSNPNRNLKFGVSDAQTYHWLHALNVLGNVGNTITANHPLAMVFIKNGVKTYVAHNYSNSPITVTFSDNYSLIVPAKSMKTSKDIDITGNLSTLFPRAYPGT